jgi:hypothetical protein
MKSNDSPTTSPTTTYQLFTAGHNMTGYMPEADTLAFTSWSDAKLYLLGAMKYAIESIETGDPDPWGETYAESLVASCEDLNLSSGPTWSDIIDAGEHASATWWIEMDTFTSRDAFYQHVSDLAALDQHDVDDLMMDIDAAFFEQNAGYARQPDETDDAARARCAGDLVKAERWAQNAGVTFDWSDDWHVTDHRAEYDCYNDGGPETCQSCTCYSSNGDVLASLGCIDDATDDYRRVVEAELALEAMGPVVTRLVSGDDQVNDSVRALLFGVLADLSAPTVTRFRSDWFHDARWIMEHVTTAPCTFHYAWNDSGTDIGADSTLVGTYRENLVRVTLVADDVDGAPWTPGRPTTFRASVERIK